MLKKILSELPSAICYLLFPPSCLSCQELIEDKQKLFCSFCSQLIHLVETHERCQKCFMPGAKENCYFCKEHAFSFSRKAYALDKAGPIHSMLQALSSSRKEEILHTMSSLLVVQFFQLNFPMPDYIISYPDIASCSLAKKMARILNRPYLSVIRSLSIPLFNSHKRLFLTRRSLIKNKTILALEVDGSSFALTEKFCSVIKQGAPKEICYLSFCGK